MLNAVSSYLPKSNFTEIDINTQLFPSHLRLTRLVTIPDLDILLDKT